MELTEIFPPYRLMVTTAELELAVATDDDLGELVDLALDGVHDPEFMPFSTEHSAVLRTEPSYAAVATCSRP